MRRRQPALRAREPPRGVAVARRGARPRRARDRDGGRAGRGRRRCSRRPADGGRRLGPGARDLPRAARGPVRAAARPRPVDGVHPRRAGDGVGLPGAVLVGAAARAVRRRPRPARPRRGRGVPVRPDRVRRRLAGAGRRRRARPAGPGRRGGPPWSGPARRSVDATGRGTACAWWPRPRYATAGASRSSGCGRPRRSSPTGVTTGSPGSAGPCSSRPGAGHPPRTGPVDRSPCPAPARHHQPRARRARTRRRRAAHARDRRPPVPLPAHGRAPRRQPAGPHRLPLPHRAAAFAHANRVAATP